LWVAIAAGLGIAVGAAASIPLPPRFVLSAAIALLICVIPRPEIMLIVLIASVFVQVITVGGVTIARICAPIALLLVVIALLRKTTLQPAAPLGWAAAYALWAVASGLWTAHLGGTLTQLASLAIAISYMLTFATLLDNRRDMDRVLYTVAFVAFAVGIDGTVASEGRAGTDTGDANFFALVEIVRYRSCLRLRRTCELVGSGPLSTVSCCGDLAAVFSSLLSLGVASSR
jgi:hypothetical protein